MTIEYLSTVDVDSADLRIIAEVEVGTNSDVIAVVQEVKNPQIFHVVKNSIVRHPGLDHLGAIRALATYLQGYGTKNNLKGP